MTEAETSRLRSNFDLIGAIKAGVAVVILLGKWHTLSRSSAGPED